MRTLTATTTIIDSQKAYLQALTVSPMRQADETGSSDGGSPGVAMPEDSINAMRF